MNKRQRVLFYFILNLYFFSSCISETKKGVFIPAVPEVNEITRRRAAIVFLTDVIDAFPNSSENYYKRAILYFENENIKLALDDINNAILIKPNVGNYFQVKALILRDSDSPRLALEAALKAEVLDIESPELYTLLGDLYQQLGQFNKAKSYLRKALQISPNNGETYFYQGEMAAKMADTSTAILLYKQVLGLKPSFLPAYLKLVQVYTNLKDYDTALMYGSEAIKYHRSNASLYLQIGNTYQSAWKADSAIINYAKAITLDTNLVEASFNTGIIYFKSRAYRFALPFFERSFRHNPKYPDAKFLMAQCLEFSGEYVKAEELYNQMLVENNQDYKALVGIARVQRKVVYRDYISTDATKIDSTAFPKFDSPKRSITDTTSLKPMLPKGIN